MAEYVTDRRLHMGYSFELLTDDFSVAYIRDTVERLERQMVDGWPCWAISNHDVQRAVTRWGGADADGDDLARQLVALVCSLRGSVCLYQGEELGLGEAEIPYEAVRDPYGLTFWPTFKGRDGCRTPMPWDGSTLAGFTTGTPWLPIPAQHRARSVAAQEPDPRSTLNAVRRFLHWRALQPALVRGDIRFLDTAEPILAFVRECEGVRLLASFNLSAADSAWSLPEAVGIARLVDVPGVRNGSVDAGQLRLPARGVLFAVLD